MRILKTTESRIFLEIPKNPLYTCVLMHFLNVGEGRIPCKSGSLADSPFLCYTNKTMNLHRNSERENVKCKTKILLSYHLLLRFSFNISG